MIVIRIVGDLLMVVGTGLYVVFMLRHVWPAGYQALIDWLQATVEAIRAWLEPPPADDWDNLLNGLQP